MDADRLGDPEGQFPRYLVMSAHAVLAPSAAARWGKCALSVALEAAYPDTEQSPESMEGTAAHWVVEMTLKGSPPSLDHLAPNGVAVSREMLDGADLVCDTIEGALGPNWRSMIAIEQPVRVSRVHATQCWGTPDYFAWVRLPDGRLMLFVFDYKFGHGVVEVFENEQLTTYAAGIMEAYGMHDLDVVVSFWVIQPRAHHRNGPARSWRTEAANLRAAVNILAMQAEKALAPNPEAVPDLEQCENCRGRHACAALQRDAYRSADKSKKLGAVELSPEALGLELRMLKRSQALLKARVEGLEAQAVSVIKQGKNVPFWLMESRAGNLDWTRPVVEVLVVGQMLGLPLAKPVDVITPTQAKNAGFPETLLSSYAARPPGSAKLVPDDGSKARSVFGSA